MIAMASSSAAMLCPVRQLRPGVRGDGLQEPASAQTELDSPAGDQVQRRDAARQHDRVAQRKVGDVRRHLDASACATR